MQSTLCTSFSRFYPMVEVGLILDDKVYTDFWDKPLLHAAAEGNTAKVIFTMQTDMRRICSSFVGPFVAYPMKFSHGSSHVISTQKKKNEAHRQVL